MRDPFVIDGPTCISFSGGRTSAYMLWRVLQSNGGLPDDAKVIFANTGKEDESTLDFVERCSAEWGVHIEWVEYRDHEQKAFRWAAVDYATSSRDGEPFAAVIHQRGKPYLPNPVKRICTTRLKVDPMVGLLYSLGWTEWDNMIGIRSDEPRRATKIRANPGGGCADMTRLMPLVDAGVTKGDVLAFWKGQPFDLQLPTIDGTTAHGNCDLCFLKGGAQILSLIAERPERAVWWARQEAITGGLFRSDRPSYAQMAKFAAEQRDMFDADEEALACFCGE